MLIDGKPLSDPGAERLQDLNDLIADVVIEFGKNRRIELFGGRFDEAPALIRPNQSQKIRGLIHVIMSLPEYQMN